jgi:hypothetical protein
MRRLLRTCWPNSRGDAEAFAAAIEASGFQELPVTARHAAAVARLPLTDCCWHRHLQNHSDS